MKPIIKYGLPLVLVSSSILVYSVIKNQSQNQININNSSNVSTNQNQTDKNIVTITLQKLSVLANRCRGCGKCVRIDPQHFEMSGNQAVVISSTNLNSSNLTLAINNCPGQAIVLE